jgi:polysaccharide biosynthesis protein PslG
LSAFTRRILLLACTLTLAWVPASHAAIPPDFVGISSDDTYAGSGHYRSSSMQQQRSVGVGLIRQILDWAMVETSPGQYNWAAYDDYVLEAAQNGMSLLAVVHNPPDFYRSSSARGWCPPRQLSTMADYARAAVRRYGPNGSLWREHPGGPSLPIRSWQIWNEPNLGVYWCNKPSPRAYANMLRVVGQAIKSEDPGAEIVTAGMPDSKLKSAMPLARYLKRLYNARGKRYFDTLAVNSYAKDNRQLSGLLKSVRRRMNRSHDRRARMWITEIGWGDWYTGPPHRFIVGAEGQAARIEQALGLLGRMKGKLRLRGVVYYSWRDLRPYPPKYNDMWGLHTGLLDVNGNPKPAYGAFQRAVAGLR